MAEIQDTSGEKPQLRRYQSRGIQVKDAPVYKGGTVETSDQKMWDSISGSLDTVINVGNKMRRLALEDEKVKISADMQSHYIDATSQLSTGMQEQTNEQLTGFEGLYGSGKLDGSYKGLKEYVVPDGYSKKAQEEMTPFIKLAEKKFQADAIKLHFGELVQRSNNQLSLLEDKSLSGLSLQLEEYESAKDTGDTFESNGKKVQKLFGFLKGEGGIDNQKAQAANNLLSVYVKNVLEGKVERGLMSQSAMDLRVYNYAQKLGAVQFEHYQGIDEEKALDLAVKKGIVLDPGGGRDKIVYNDPKLGTYINQARIRERSELQTNNRNIHLREQKLLYEGKGAKNWLEGIGRAFDPDAIREGEPTVGVKWEAGKPGESIAGTIEQKVTRSKRKYTAKEQESRMNTMAEVIFKRLGKESGFTSAEHVKSAYMGMVLEAKGEKEKYIKFKRSEDERRTSKYLGRLKGHFANVRQHPDKLKRFQIISHSHEVDPVHDIWRVKESYIKEMVEDGQINETDARNFMLTVTPGISTRSPGAGLGPTGMKNLQNALASYYQNELFVKKDNSKGGAASYNPDPMQLEITLPNGKVQKLKDEYNLYQLNHAEKTLLANQRNQYEEILDFNNDRFILKGTKTLSEGWRKIADKQGSDSAQRSRAMSVIGDNYVNNILIPRIKALLEDPNGTIMKDLEIDFNIEEGLSDDDKERITKRWNLLGEDRSLYYSHTESYAGGKAERGRKGKVVWIYLNKNTLQGMGDPFRLQPTTIDFSSKVKQKTAKETLAGQ